MHQTLSMNNNLFFRACKETSTAAALFAKAKYEMEAHCQKLENIQLLKMEGKKVYWLHEFEELQTVHQKEVRLLSEHQSCLL